MRILLVEDNPGDARLLEVMLKEAGSVPLEVRHADRLSTGLKDLAEMGIDVVLLDLSLPDSQGVETLVRMHAGAKGVPIVVLTGVEDEALGALVQAGAQDYLVKGQVTGPLLTRPLRYAAERKRTEEKLRSSETRIRLLLESTGEGIYGIDPAGRCTFINRAAANMLGYGPEDVLGQEMHALIHHHRRNSLPYPSEECQIYQVLKSRQGCHVDDEVLWRQDGTAFPAYYSAYPIEEQGTMKGVVVAFTNITERKRAELALRDSEERHQMIAQATNDGLWDWNVTTNTMWWSENLLTLFGYQPGAIKPSYEAWGALLHPDDRVRVMDRIRAVLENGQNVFADEYRCHRTDGTYAYVFDRAYILRDQAGVPLRMIGAMMDMTERKRMELALGESERQLRQALDEREQLSLDLHDNIIQSIYAVGLCLEECQHLLQQDVKRVDKRLNLAITDLNYVIRDVRNYIAGDTSGVITPTQLREELSRLTQITKGADLLRFRLRLDPLAVKLLTPDEARHILFIAQEAMSNSLRHAHAKHGYVSILMKDGCLRLEVKDDGLGFQASDIPEGQGLRNIAARALKLQARIQVISEAGFGTLIILDIPKENRHGPHNQ